MLASRVLSAIALCTTVGAGTHLTWDTRPNTPWAADTTVNNAVKRTHNGCLHEDGIVWTSSDAADHSTGSIKRNHLTHPTLTGADSSTKRNHLAPASDDDPVKRNRLGPAKEDELVWTYTDSTSLADHILKRHHHKIEPINTTTVHNAPIINGAWNISNASIPADWLCVALWNTAIHTTGPSDQHDTHDYACMPQKDFALIYRESLVQSAKYMGLVIALTVVTILLCATIAACIALLIKTNRQREKLEKQGIVTWPDGGYSTTDSASASIAEKGKVKV